MYGSDTQIIHVCVILIVTPRVYLITIHFKDRESLVIIAECGRRL